MASIAHRLSQLEDKALYPQLTAAGEPSDVFERETPLGLVSSRDFETGSSSETAVEHQPHQSIDPEKGSRDYQVVTWKENDPENPRHWSNRRKWLNTGLASLLCFNVGLASSIITGGLVSMAEAFHVSNEVVALTVSLFVVGFGVGPLVFSPLSELYGRRIIYLVSMLIFVTLTIPSAVARNHVELWLWRLFAGLGASACMTNAGGSIADVWDAETRGYKMSLFSSVLFASPCLGPPIGGYINMYLGWRWIWNVLLIFSAVVWIVAFFCLEETYAPYLLARRAQALRKEHRSDIYVTAQELKRRPFSEVVRETLLRPLVLLTTEPTMIFFSIYLCLIYSLLYGFFFAYPIVFVRGHGFNDGQVGLCFFGIFIGIVICGAIACPFQERYYLRKVKEGNGTTVPESRLPLMMVGSIVLPISLFIFAWTSMPHVSWVGPAVAGVPFGFALIAIYISANVYLVDVYSNFAASALAAKTLARSLVGASVPLWIEYEYAALGNAWAGSVFAFVALAMVPIPFAFYKYGARIRSAS